jgi:hypothetical protein
MDLAIFMLFKVVQKYCSSGTSAKVVLPHKKIGNLGHIIDFQ